jgi:hypothetical protein
MLWGRLIGICSPEDVTARRVCPLQLFSRESLLDSHERGLAVLPPPTMKKLRTRATGGL